MWWKWTISNQAPLPYWDCFALDKYLLGAKNGKAQRLEGDSLFIG